MEDSEEAQKLEKSVLKVFDKHHNSTNESSEAEALELLSKLPNPAEVRDDDKRQYILLHHACYNGWYKVAKVLIEKYNCNPNCRNAAGSIPLQQACLGGNLNLVKYLVLDKGCDPNDMNNIGQVPLHNAALGGHLDVIKFLFEEQHIDQSVSDKYGRTSLHFASLNGHVVVAKYLIEEKQCDPSCTDNNGWMPLHYACQEGYMDVIKYLIEERKCNPSCKKKDGQTPLHSACLKGHLYIAKYLIEKHKCDPECKTNDGHTPLHFACINGHLSIAKYFIEEQHIDQSVADKRGLTPLHLVSLKGHLNVLKYLIEEQQCDPLIQDILGQTPLHLACQNGHLDVVNYLTIEQHCDPVCTDYFDETPLHNACQAGHLELVEYLIEILHCNPNCKLGLFGQTPLHSACKGGHLNVAKYLIEECECDPNYRVGIGSSPLSLACKSHQLHLVMYLVNECHCSLINSDMLISSDFVKHYTDIAIFLISSCKINYPNADLKNLLLYPAFKLFVIGNFSSGKSTLVRAIQEHFQDDPNFAQKVIRRYKKVSNVELYTAGIVSTDLQIPNCGRVIIYDFAGQAEYYSSHAALCENLMTSQGCLITVVFNLSKDIDDCVQELQFWKLFIDNQVGLCNHYPPIIFVASYADIVKLQGLDPSDKAKQVIETSFGEQGCHKVVFLDCRLMYSPGLQIISDSITKYCSKYQESNNVKIKIHLLLYFIRMHFKEEIGCLLEKVFKLIISLRRNKFLERNGQLPETIYELSDLMTSLNESGELLYLKNDNDISKSWVILKKDTLFSEIHGTIFAPKSFKNYHKLTKNSTGVVPLSNIGRALSQYDPQMLVQFMIHFELCHKISSHDANYTLINSESSCSALDNIEDSESFYFFPALVKQESPSEAFFNQPYKYKYGWCLQRVNVYQYLSSRFLHTLLLRLAFTFALDCEQKIDSISLQRECNVWRNGIHWVNNGIEVVMEVVEQSTAVIVVFGCNERNVIPCLQVRSAIIHMVLSAANQFCGAVELKEYFVDPEELNSYPLRAINDLFKYSMSRLSSTIKERNDFITVKPEECFKSIEIDKLLYFEPYTCLSEEMTLKLLDENNQDLEASDDLLHECAKIAHPKMALLKKILLLPEHDSEYNTSVKGHLDQFSDDPTHKCFHIFKTWQKFTPNPTYRGLREALDSYSIFRGRSPLPQW